jgi:hypothetical protein
MNLRQPTDNERRTQEKTRTSVMPFGKFKGLAVSEIYETQPSYLAWFHETVQGCEAVKEAIRGVEGIEAHLAAFRQGRRQQPKQLSPVQQEVERLMERFTTLTVDAACAEMLCGEE